MLIRSTAGDILSKRRAKAVLPVTPQWAQPRACGHDPSGSDLRQLPRTVWFIHIIHISSSFLPYLYLSMLNKKIVMGSRNLNDISHPRANTKLLITVHFKYLHKIGARYESKFEERISKNG
jgi:hypothetical protein